MNEMNEEPLKAKDINPWSADIRGTISRHDLLLLAETTERLQKELGWICAWIRNQSERMGIKIEQ